MSAHGGKPRRPCAPEQHLYNAPLFKKEKDSAQGDFYEYTQEGLLKCAISAGMRYAYDYDEMGRMIRKSASGRTLLALEYDRNGNKVRQTDVTGKVTGFEYDRQGQLLRLTDDGQELASYAYNLDGTPRAVTHGPIRQEYAYDLDKNLTGLTVRSGDTLLAQTGYAYDGNGNRIRKQALDGMTLYQYDALNQLQRVDYPAYSEELFYDKAGNRARRLLDGEEELYQYDPRNRLMAYTKNGATTPFQYDNAGNLLQDDKAKYTYDAFNRTVKVETFDGNVQVNRYDAEGLRHEMEENGRLVRFIFHKGEAVAEQEENSNVIRLIRGSELIARSSDSESARTYYHYASDEMGSTTHIVDENGSVKNRYAYDAWGKITAKEEAVPNRFTYYGQQIDPITQQYYLRARFYNPILGRFTQEDTYRGDGLNLYAYCANNPVYYIDPSGFYKDAVDKAIKRTLSGRADSLTSAEKQAFYDHVNSRVKSHEVLTPDELRTLEILQTGKVTLTTRAQAWNQIKRMLGIPMGQQPASVEKVFLEDPGRTYMMYPDTHYQVSTRTFTYNVSGLVDSCGEPISQVVIQEHSYGHIYGGGAGLDNGNQFSHFNVRPEGNLRTGSIQGVPKHFYFDRNT